MTKVYRTEAPQESLSGDESGVSRGHGSKRPGCARGAYRAGDGGAEAPAGAIADNAGASIESNQDDTGRENPAGFRSGDLLAADVEVVEVGGNVVERYSVRITET